MGLRRLEPFVLTHALQSLAPFVSTQVSSVRMQSSLA